MTREYTPSTHMINFGNIMSSVLAVKNLVNHWGTGLATRERMDSDIDFSVGVLHNLRKETYDGKIPEYHGVLYDFVISELEDMARINRKKAIAMEKLLAGELA